MVVDAVSGVFVWWSSFGAVPGGPPVRCVAMLAGQCVHFLGAFGFLFLFSGKTDGGAAVLSGGLLPPVVSCTLSMRSVRSGGVGTRVGGLAGAALRFACMLT